jgi:hypothetical protein
MDDASRSLAGNNLVYLFYLCEATHLDFWFSRHLDARFRKFCCSIRPAFWVVSYHYLQTNNDIHAYKTINQITSDVLVHADDFTFGHGLCNDSRMD